MSELSSEATIFPGGRGAAGQPEVKRSPLARRLRFVRDRPALTAASATLVIILLLSLLAPLLPIADPYEVDIVNRYLPPASPGHPLGTDQLGRDVLSRLIWGGRVSILTGMVANIVVTVLGVCIGLVAGYSGGRVDQVIMRAVDVMLAFPGLLLTLALLAFMGASVVNLVIAIIIGSVPSSVRFVRAEVLNTRQLKFVEAAQILGYSRVRIMFGEILPYVMPFILTLTALRATGFFLATTGLSLLGLGVTPPTPDWGSMVGQGMRAIYEAPHTLIAPTIVIAVIAVCFNVIGDEIQDILRPQR